MLKVKELILGILTIVSSLIAFWLWQKTAPLIAAGEFSEYINFVLPLVSLVISVSLFSLSATFIQNKRIIYPVGLTAVGVPYLFTPATNIVIGALVISLGLALFAIHHIHKEHSLSLGFSISKMTKTGLPIYFTVVSLIISIFYFGSITEEKAFSSILPKPVLNLVLKNLSGPLGSLTDLDLPALNPEATIDEVLLKLVEKQLQSQDVAMARLSHQGILSAVAAQREELAKNFGIKLKGQEKIGDVLYGTMSQRVEELLGTYKKYLPAASAIAFFLAFKTFTIPVYYLTTLVIFLLIKIMVWSKILRSEKQQIEVERLTL